jgi:death-on-curing family protein
LATEEEISYIDFPDAVRLHFKLMELWGEVRYEEADLIRQAASLCFGLIKNHPWIGGNKRTASFLMEEFLFRNGFELNATSQDLIEMSLAVESDAWKVDEIENWLRNKVKKIAR